MMVAVLVLLVGADAPPLTVDDAVATALQNNLVLQVAGLQVDEVRAHRGDAFTLKDPELRLRVGHFESLYTPSLPTDERGLGDRGVSEQPLFSMVGFADAE